MVRFLCAERVLLSREIPTADGRLSMGHPRTVGGGARVNGSCAIRRASRPTNRVSDDVLHSPWAVYFCTRPAVLEWLLLIGQFSSVESRPGHDWVSWRRAYFKR